MPKQARPIKSPPKKPAKRKPVRKKVAPGEPFRFIVFGDLHVNNETLERACELLSIVGDKAREYEAGIVCLGDFWDMRGTLDVRQVEQILSVLESIKARKIFIPGNHDQVALDGTIHGMNIFRGYQDIEVATDRIIVNDGTQTVFIPWRERPEEQREIFDLSRVVNGFNWALFGHAEVAGAIANSGKKASGLVTAKQIEKVARACYLGHYHKRQQIGDRIWYIGSPYELDIGERGQPHGIALITNEQIEPVWFDLDIFPRYWRFNYGDEWDLSAVKENDIVEVQAYPQDMMNPEFAEALSTIPANVRTAPKALPSDEGAPAFALKLDDAIAQYVNQELERISHPFNEMDLVALGRDILSQVPEATALKPLGAEVSITGITLKDFCVISGELFIDVSEMGRALITGPIGMGKTAIADAAGWCLFGSTTPRKAGQIGATLRADDVINDYATECSVACNLEVGGKSVTVTRTKQRGKGSTVSIKGIKSKEGISDQQKLIRQIIGYPYELWRACVALGQGAVANFATDADKRRKDLLSSAFDLESCPAAQKVAKKRLDTVNATLENSKRQQLVYQTEKNTLETQNFKTQIEQWELQKQAELDHFTKVGNEAKQKIAQCEDLLKGEGEWIKSKSLHDQRIDNITKQLAELRPTKRIAELQRQYGALEAERAIIERDRNNAQTELNRLIEQANSGAAICPECGQALPKDSVEQHIQSHEAKVVSKATELKTFQSRMVNIAAELDALNTGGSEEKEQRETALAESREALKKCDEALPQFARIRENMQNAQKALDDARADYTRKAAVQNPFEEQAKQNKAKIEELTSKIETLATEVESLSNEKDSLLFWVEGFGAKGLPVLVLRTALYELELAANRYISKLLDGKVHCRLAMDGDDLRVLYFEQDMQGNIHERAYEKLSGGQRRCVELAFAPFALSDLIFNRCGVKINLLTIDELTTHLGQTQKRRVCEILENLDRPSIIAIDHDLTVRGYFDKVYELIRTDEQATLEIVS